MATKPKDMSRTRKALAIYDRGEAKRRARWDRIGSNRGVRICETADRLALFKVQMAFAVDTYEVNSMENCTLVGVDFIRKCAAK